jgi:uncharacterized protein YbjQ (UPF0145 family)
MKKWILLIAILGISLMAAGAASARDTAQLLSIADGLETKGSKETLDGSVKFFFGDQQHPKILTKIASDFSNRKTNAFGKSDEVACQWAFMSVLLALQKRAHELGANAVVNIVSYYKKNEYSSETDYECHAGGLMAGVALKGDFVKIADQ